MTTGLRTIIAAIAVLLMPLCASAARNAAKQHADSVNRAVATVMASSIDDVLADLVKSGVPLDRSQVGRYVADFLAGKDLGFTRGSASTFVDGIIYANRPVIPDTVPAAREQAFVDSIAAADNATITPTGLVFVVITEGEGIQPTLNDKVQVRYTGRLSNGIVFDDTEDDTVQFDVSGVIPGFTEALMMMKPGGTYRAIIPAKLGYGPTGIPGIIPGNSTLDFTVTLEAIRPSTPTAP